MGIRGQWATISTYIAGMQTTMCVGGRGGRGFCAKIYLKLEFWARIIPIVASVSLRQIPSDPIGFRGQWETIPTYIDGGAGNKVRGRGGRARQPKFLSRNLPKIRVFSAAYPNFSFRQLPWASVGFRGQWETISTYNAGEQTTMYLGGGRPEAKVPVPIFT